MNASDQSRQMANALWDAYQLPENVAVESEAGWRDDGEGELVRPVFLSFDDDHADAASTRAHFVVPYNTGTGELLGEGELRVTDTGAVLGHAEPIEPARIPGR